MRWILTTGVAGVFGWGAWAASAPRIPPETLEPVELPVRVLRLRFVDQPDLNSALEDGEITRMFEAVNAIWEPYGIRWIPQKPVIVDVQGGAELAKVTDPRDYQALPRIMSGMIQDIPEGYLWQVAFLRRFPVKSSGVYAPRLKTVFLGEIDPRGEPTNPAILAHELGHGLGLPHVEDPDNLMYGGGAGPHRIDVSRLEEDQVRAALEQAEKGPFDEALTRPPGEQRARPMRPGEPPTRPGDRPQRRRPPMR